MWKWLFLVIAVVLLSAGVGWYLTKDMGTDLSAQIAQVEDPSPTSEEKSSTLAPDQNPQPQGPGPGWALNCICRRS